MADEADICRGIQRGAADTNPTHKRGVFSEA
jgi:hypothetical protein